MASAQDTNVSVLPAAQQVGGNVGVFGSVSVVNQPTVNLGVGAGQQPSSGSLPVTLASDQVPLPTTLGAGQIDDDGIPYVNPNVPGADIATGDRQNQIIALLQQLLAGSPVSQQGPWTVTISSQPATVLAPNAAQEQAGQLQRVADLLEAVLIELRTHSAILASLGQSVPDDPDRIRNDLSLALQ